MPGKQKSFVVALMLVAVSTTACEDGEPFQLSRFPQVAEVGNSLAYGIWTPSGTDTCTQAIHDSYSVVGPDGLRYPTWHPPVDPATGCTFGHEHGRDRIHGPWQMVATKPPRWSTPRTRSSTRLSRRSLSGAQPPGASTPAKVAVSISSM